MTRCAIVLRISQQIFFSVLVTVIFNTNLSAQQMTAAITGHFSGPDRTSKLITGSLKEGTVTVYAANDAIRDAAAHFQLKYGIKVNVWEGSAADIRNRVIAESRAGRYDVDVIDSSGVQIEAINREELLQEIESPVYRQLMSQAVVQNRPWVASHLLIFTAVYNTNLVKRSELPGTYDDLLSRNWKGKLGIEGGDSDWFMAILSGLGEQRGQRLFAKVISDNGISVRKGHGLLANLVSAGEVPLALNVYLHEIEELKRAGAPVEVLFLPNVIATPSGAAVTKKAPHPNAAVLFLDYLLSDGQKILSDAGDTATNLKYQNLPKGLEVTFVDVPKFLAESSKWNNLLKMTLAGKAE